MVKVLNVISDTNIGGAGRVLLNYLKHSDTTHFETSVCLPEGSLLEAPLRETDATVYTLPLSADKSFDRKDIVTLKALIKKNDPDIVHTHGCLSGRIAGRRAGKIVIYTRHSVFPISPLIRSGPGHLLNKLVNEHYADRIIAVSPAARENLRDGGIRDDIIDVIMNGVEPVERVSAEIAALLRAQLGIEPEDFVLGILARLESYKGHTIILEAVKSLTDDGRRVKLLIAGSGTDDAALRQRVKELGLSDAVRFLGFVTDTASVLSVLNVQLNASYGTEATSLSLLEGMSLGLPAIVSDYGGNPYVIEDGVNGLVFKSRDSGALAERIRRLMEAPDTLKQLGSKAVDIYNTNFTGEIFTRSVENIYRKALEGAHDGHSKK